VPLFIIGTDTAKDSVYARLRLPNPGPGFCHFPKDRDEAYFKGLTSERVVTKYVKGFPVREWVKPSNARNEPLDCRVYAYSALASLNVNWARALREAETAPRSKTRIVRNERVPITKMPEAPAITHAVVGRKPLFQRRTSRSTFMG
jgi:phage terminase large subunit GpA-like protein